MLYSNSKVMPPLYGEDFETPNSNYNWKENPIYQKGNPELAKVVLKK